LNCTIPDYGAKGRKEKKKKKKLCEPDSRPGAEEDGEVPELVKRRDLSFGGTREQPGTSVWPLV